MEFGTHVVVGFLYVLTFSYSNILGNRFVKRFFHPLSRNLVFYTHRYIFPRNYMQQKHEIYTSIYTVVCEVYISNTQSNKVIKYFSIENVGKIDLKYYLTLYEVSFRYCFFSYSFHVSQFKTKSYPSLVFTTRQQWQTTSSPQRKNIGMTHRTFNIIWS
jgi:hypothetical protein